MTTNPSAEPDFARRTRLRQETRLKVRPVALKGGRHRDEERKAPIGLSPHDVTFRIDASLDQPSLSISAPSSGFMWQGSTGEGVKLLRASRQEGPENTVMAALLSRYSVAGGQTEIAAFLGGKFLGLRTSKRWTEAISTALLGGWSDPLDSYSAQRSQPQVALALLLQEAKEIHTQLVPLWERRTYGNRRVRLLESPVYEGATLRDVLADRSLPEDSVIDEVPGDQRLAAVLQCLAATERAVVIAYGRPGVTTWWEAAELAGAEEPAALGERVRRKVRRVVAELQRRDRHRRNGPTNLWTEATSHGGGQ